MALRNRYSDSNGSATNGGSTPGNPLVSGTGWTASGTTVTASGINSGGVSVNDLVYLASATGGFGTTCFRITALGGNANTVTVHAAPGAGNASYVWRVGGAVTIQRAFAIAQPGDVFYHKGDVTLTGSISAGTAGTGDSPVKFCGYKTTPGDGWLGRTFGGFGAIVTTNMPTLNLNGNFIITLGNYWVFESFNVISSLRTAGACLSGNTAYSVVRGCRIENGADNASAGGARVGIYLDCDVVASGAQNAYALDSPTLAARCRVSGTNRGILTSTSAMQVVKNCIISAPVGLYASYFFAAFDTLFWGCSTAAVQTINSNVASFPYTEGCVFRDCAKRFDNLYSATAHKAAVVYGARTYGITSGDTGFSDWLGAATWDDITAIGDDFVDAVNGDFRLIRTSQAHKPTQNGSGNPLGDFGPCPRISDYPPVAKVLDDTTYDALSGQTGITGTLSAGGGNVIVIED